MDQTRRDSMLDWLPVLVSYSGLLGMLAAAAFWALTGRIDPLVLGAFGTLLTTGEAGRLARNVARERNGR